MIRIVASHQAWREKENDLNDFTDRRIEANQLMQFHHELFGACQQFLPVDIDVDCIARSFRIEMDLIAVDTHQVHGWEEEKVMQIGSH